MQNRGESILKTPSKNFGVSRFRCVEHKRYGPYCIDFQVFETIDREIDAIFQASSNWEINTLTTEFCQN